MFHTEQIAESAENSPTCPVNHHCSARHSKRTPRKCDMMYLDIIPAYHPIPPCINLHRIWDTTHSVTSSDGNKVQKMTMQSKLLAKVNTTNASARNNPRMTEADIVYFHVLTMFSTHIFSVHSLSQKHMFSTNNRTTSDKSAYHHLYS